jgi:hypothetical protein
LSITPDQIQELESLLYDPDKIEALASMVETVKEWQPDLFEWLTHKFNTLSKPNALLGVTVFAMILLKNESEEL